MNLFERILLRRSIFIEQHEYEPEKIFVDGVTYLKLENMANMYSYYKHDANASKIYGMDIDVVPLPYEFIEFGYKNNSDNVELSLKYKNSKK